VVRTKILPYPRNHLDKPYSHLQPLVDAMIEAGNEPVRDGGFYMDRDGWRCDLKRSIDFQLLANKFEFPKSIILSEPLDKIFCQNTWVEIKGSVDPQ